MSLRKIIGLVLAWRVMLTFTSAIALVTIPYEPTFPYARELLPQYGHRLLTSWASFDGVHYLTIIQEGYTGSMLLEAFFPVYPLLTYFLTTVVVNPIIAGLLISTVCFGLGLFVLNKLIKLDYGAVIAKRVLWIIILFPTAFYFTSMYTEGLFFLLSVLSIYWARQRHWWRAGIVGAILSATRITGILILPVLLIEYIIAYRNSSKPIYPLASIGLTAAGLFS